MTTVYWDKDPDYWGDAFTHRFLSAWAASGNEALALFAWLCKNRRIPSAKLTSYETLRELGLYMPRKKGEAKNATGDSRFGGKQPVFGNELKWINIPLSDEDVDVLSRSESSVEFLAASLCALAVDGYGFSVKPVDSGKSLCCTINRPDLFGDGVAYGMSSFAGELRDVLLVALYKFDVKLEGDFSNCTPFLETSKPRQRFR